MSRRILDAYPTENGVTRALLNRVDIHGTIFCPTSGDGIIADYLHSSIEPRPAIITNDIDPKFSPKVDYTMDATEIGTWQHISGSHNIEWVVDNIPYKHALTIADHAMSHTGTGVALLLRISFLEPAGQRSGNRGEWLDRYADKLSNVVFMGNPRPSYTGNGKTDSATTAWLVWRHNWSWKALGIDPPFMFATGWKNDKAV
jgi:hypothetical protein